MSNNPYDDIDYCLELLYDSIYKDDTTELYKLERIIRKDIKISDLKKDKDFDFSKILSNKFKLHGYYNDRLHYTRIGDIYPSTMSVGFCNKKINLNDQLRPELYHMAMLYISTELIFDEKFNHTLLPIMCFDIKKQDLLKYLPNVEKDFGSNFQKDNDNMYIIITEHYSKIYTLREYLDTNKDTLTLEQIKSILFQIYVTIIKLNERFNKFRHNKLNLDAILVLPKEKKDDIYKIGGNTFKIIENEFDIKITDFDYSYHISDYIRNDNKIIKFEGGNIENPYYDIHYITNLLYLYFESNKDNENIYKIIKKCADFFNEIIPEKYRINTLENYKGMNQDLFNKSSDEIISPLKIINKNIFFKNFIMENIKENIELLNVKESGIKYIESNFLNKFQNKISNQYYSNMLSGKRRISGLVSLTESSVNNSVTSESVLSGGAKKTGKTNKVSASSTSFTFTENSKSVNDATIVNPELTSVTSTQTGTGKKSSKSSKSTKSSKSSVSHSSRKQKGGKSERSSSSSSSSESSSSSNSSSSTESEKKSKQEAGQNLEYINYLNPKVKNQLKKLPEGYMDLAPDHLLQNMPNLDQNVDGVAGMGDMGQMNPPAAMGAMPQLGMMNPAAAMGQMPPAMMSAPPMPAEMQQIAMGAMGNGMMNQQLQTPMMNNPMSQFMGMQPQMPGMQMPGMQMPGMQMPGMQMGGAKQVKKYKLVFDKKNNFFF